MKNFGLTKSQIERFSAYIEKLELEVSLVGNNYRWMSKRRIRLIEVDKRNYLHSISIVKYLLIRKINSSRAIQRPNFRKTKPCQSIPASLK